MPNMTGFCLRGAARMARPLPVGLTAAFFATDSAYAMWMNQLPFLHIVVGKLALTLAALSIGASVGREGRKVRTGVSALHAFYGHGTFSGLRLGRVTDWHPALYPLVVAPVVAACIFKIIARCAALFALSGACGKIRAGRSRRCLAPGTGA